MGRSNLKKKKKTNKQTNKQTNLHGTQVHGALVPKHHYRALEFFFFFFKFSVCYNLIIQKLSFKLKLDF